MTGDRSAHRQLLVCAAVQVATLCFLANTVSAQTDARAVRQVTEQPVRFEANRGQADARVRYVSRARDYTVALTDDEALLLLRKPSSSRQSRLQASDLALVRMRLAGASRTPRITASDPLPGNVYYAGAGAPASLTPIDTFARVAYAGVYPGIDLVYYGDDHHLEFDFLVAPFADPKQIALSLDGADSLTLTDAGDLAMRVEGAEVRLEKPLVYQERDGHRIEVAGAYVLPADDVHTVRFRLGSYDPSLPLVIDPAWMTVFGSTNEDRMSGFAVDSAGHPRLLGETFDPATFPFTQLESGVLPSPNCFLTKLDGQTGLTTYTILFANTQRCERLALAPNGAAYFAGFVYPNALQNNQGTTVTAVDDSSGVPVISRFGVSNYDSTAPGEGVAALAVNSLGHVFLLGPCRIVEPGSPPLQLSGYNETPDPAQPFVAEGCAPPTPGTSEKYQPVLTVVDRSGAFLYGSFLSPREEVTRYGLAADDADRAYIVGGQVEPFTVLPTADAYRAACPAGGSVSELCAYLMVLDTTTAGSASLVYASYLWNSQDVETVAVRLGPAGSVYVASEGRVFDDFPSNRPTNPSSWPYSLYPALREGIQLARFSSDANGLPSQFEFATVFDPHRGVTALDGQIVRHELAGLALFPSGAPAVASVAHTASLAPMGIVTTFAADGDRLGEVWTQNLGTRTPVGFGVGTGAGGSLFVAGQIEQVGAQDSDVFVERIDAVDPSANRPPTVHIFEALTTVYADSPSAGALLQINAIATDPEGDPLTYSWTGPFTDNPVTTNNYLIARVPLGMQQTVTVTVDDGHGHVVSASRTFDVVGTPFVGTTATPVDSDLNGLVYNYAPITITATGIGAGGGNAYLHTRLDQTPPIPAHLQAGSPPIYFDLSTDATLVAPITLCADTRGMSFANPANIRLYQQSGPLGAWVDITSAGYPQGNQLCGQSDTLGTFAIFYPQVPATAVRTIAGNGVREGSNDGVGGNPIDDFQDGPATSTALPYLYGGAYDRANNHLFVSGGDDILRLNLNNNTIARVAGNGVGVLGSIDGPGGDPRDDLVEGGDAFNTYVGGPAELVVSPTGDVVFFDRNTCLIRRLDAQGRLWAVAGNGTCGFSGDGFSAGLASLSYGQMAFDRAGNLFLADYTNARVRRIDALTNVIDTVAGDGTYDIPVNGASARSATGLPAGIAFDSQGHLVVAGGMHLLRISPGADGLVDGDADELISVIGGCNTNCMLPFNGDGVEVSHPQVYLPGLRHLTVAQDGAVIFQDYFRIRRIAPGDDGIVTGASDDIISTIGGYYDWATLSQIPNFNGDTFATQSLFGGFMVVVDDAQGGIIVVDGNNFRVRRFGLPLVGGPLPATINTLTVPDAIEGTPYSATITAAGGSGAGYNWSISAGALPAGLALAQAGTPSTTISGTPTEDGTFNFTVQLTDSAGSTATRAFALVVASSVIEITVTETIAVIDGPALLPSALIAITEQIAVTDTPGLLPSAMIGIIEEIVVADAALVVPPAVIDIVEQIVVSDAPGILPSVMVGISEQIVVSDGLLVEPEVVTTILLPAFSSNAVGDQRSITAETSDSSDEGARVVLTSLAGDTVRVQFRDPGAVNAPLSVAVASGNPLGGSDVIVSLATTATGALSSTAAQVVAALNAMPAVGPLLSAQTWPGSAGTGIVAPKPLSLFTPVQFTIDGSSTLTDTCLTSVPGRCSITYTRSIAGVDQINGYLDANRNGTNQPDEPLAFALAEWIDVTPLVLTLPANITVLASSPSGTAVEFIVTASDPLVTPFCSHASGSTFPIGTTTVTCTATGASGNVASGSFTVTVNAPLGETPSLSLPGNLTVPATSASGAMVTYTASAWVSGGFGGPIPVVPLCFPPSGSTFPIGTTTVNCTATNPLLPPPFSFPATGSFTVTVLPFVPPPPVITALTPETSAAGSADLAISVAGTGFISGATALWNGAPRPTVVNSDTQLTVTIPAADLATTADLTTTQITVSNPGAVLSNPLAFVITGPQVVTVDAEVARAGGHAIASNAPTQPAQHGVTATLINNNPASTPATVAVASYGTNPVGDALFAAGGFFDIQVTGADPTDSLTANLYYPNTVIGSAELVLRLRYWNGAAWLLVIGSGGVVPLKNTADNLDGTTSGGRFTVTLDSSSIPAITDLGGTVFALVAEPDRVAPVTTIEQSPAPNAHGWNNTDVAVTLAATDNLSGVALTEFAVNGGAWQAYHEPIVLRHSGIYDLAYRSVDGEGNVERAKTTRVRIDKSEPLAIVVALPTLLIPANGRMVDVSVVPLALDLLSGIDGLTLVSVTSNDPGMTADDVSGWSIGTNDYRGKLRAERTASGNRRIYTLTYRVTDRAGNEALATALVVVPGVRD